MITSPLLSTPAIGLPLLRRGKVRDVYDAGDTLLIVATDRISAFDHVLGIGHPGQGPHPTQLSRVLVRRLGDLTPHHLLVHRRRDLSGERAGACRDLVGRSMLVRRTTPLPVECVARGYLAGIRLEGLPGHGHGSAGTGLPAGLRQCDRLPEPIFTPATKAESGHDENITEEQAAAVLGQDVFAQVKTLTLALYRAGADTPPRTASWWPTPSSSSAWSTTTAPRACS